MLLLCLLVCTISCREEGKDVGCRISADRVWKGLMHDRIARVDLQDISAAEFVDYLNSHLGNEELEILHGYLHRSIEDESLRGMKVNIQLRNAPIGRVLIYGCWQLQCDIELKDNSIRIYPLGSEYTNKSYIKRLGSYQSDIEDGSSVQKLHNIMIPVIDFHDTYMPEAADFLRFRAMELDESSGGGGVQFVVIQNASKEASEESQVYIDESYSPKEYKARNVSLLKASNDISKLVDMEVMFDGYAIIFHSKQTQ